MKHCPLCKKEVTIDSLLTSTTHSVNDVAIFDISLINDDLPFDIDSQSQCHFDKGEAISFTTNCPHQCGLNILGVFSNQKNDEKNHYLLKETILKEWNKIDHNIQKNYCPSCYGKMDYDEYEFIYPIERVDVNDLNSVIKFRVSCDASGCGCGLSIIFQANRKEAKNIGKELWNKFY